MRVRLGLSDRRRRTRLLALLLFELLQFGRKLLAFAICPYWLWVVALALE